uniref:SWIM-type domain-containing protein n=1 Tax=Magallana gigas TaxID=29159 RepID=A0A8W8MTH7_MAGGI
MNEEGNGELPIDFDHDHIEHCNTETEEEVDNLFRDIFGEHADCSLPPFHAVTYDCLDQSHIPTLTFSDIYSFIIERPTSHGIAVKNFKGFNKSIKHFEAGDVQDIRVSEVNSSIIYVRATCQASIKKQQYQVYTCMSKPNTSTPHIRHAYCQCPIGLAQACSHIGALLLALSHAKPSKSSPESCTFQPCKWIIPGRQVKPTGPITSLPNKCKGQ